MKLPIVGRTLQSGAGARGQGERGLSPTLQSSPLHTTLFSEKRGEGLRGFLHAPATQSRKKSILSGRGTSRLGTLHQAWGHVS